jgi:arginyl-tRNA synthetase
MTLINLVSSFKDLVQERILALLKKEFGIENPDVSQFKFEIPPDEKMGHLAFACFPLAKIAKKAPPLIAKNLADSWGQSPQFSKIAAVGPYLNFHFHPAFLAEALLQACAEDATYGDNEQGKGKSLMVEYSSPNTNKPLHLGHCRNNLLGIVLSNLMSKNGFEVVKANLVNDRGVHICKSMLAYERWGKGETPESIGRKGDKLVGKYYVLYNKKEKEDPEILKEVQQMLRDWEAGKPEVIELWKKMNSWVMKGFHETYERMGASFDRFYFESETYKGGKEIVLQALERGQCYEEENGAVAIDLEDENLGRKILLRGDGTAMYMTQDINTTVRKFTDYDLAGSLFVVGNEQDNHFRILFRVLKRFGYEWADLCEHISYGMITLPEGKMKSREGTVVDLDDLMDEMKTLALEEIMKRREIAEEDITESVQETAEAIGQAAIKYFILKTSAVKEISFNPKESLSFEGATGPYLQYTHARICSVLRKAGEKESCVSSEPYSWNTEETTLLMMLARYPEIISQASKDRNPAVLCSFVYDLCRAFNKFYYDHPILKAENELTVDARLNLTKAVKGVLFKTLEIFGITALEKM